jgi:hypothetical protein
VRSGGVLNSSSDGTWFEFQPEHLHPDRGSLRFSSVPAHKFEQEWSGDQQGKTEGAWGKAVPDSISSTANVLKKLPRKEGRFGFALCVQLSSV